MNNKKRVYYKLHVYSGYYLTAPYPVSTTPVYHMHMGWNKIVQMFESFSEFCSKPQTVTKQKIS